jgi:hypothetical protein
LSRRSRVRAYGGATVLVVAGIACAVLVSGTAGEALAMAVVGVGLVGVVSLVFLEIGLSEDRERAGRRLPPPSERPARPPRPRPRRPDRMRGQRRRLR